MQTKILKNKIEQAAETLLPLFKISNEEYSKFQNAIIIREFEENDYPGRGTNSPGYDGMRNLFYWPKINPLDGLPESDVFATSQILRNVGSYLHFQINPQRKKGHLIFKETGEFPESFTLLTDLVSEYGNIILGQRDFYDNMTRNVFKKNFQVYLDHGPEFLPKLARMSLEEAIKEGILPS